MFGEFDYIVWVKGKDANKELLAPGESAVLVIDIEGAGPFSASDFLSATSAIEAGEVSAIVAATLASARTARSEPPTRRSRRRRLFSGWGSACWPRSGLGGGP